MTSTSLIYDVFQYVMVGGLVAACASYCILALAPNTIKEPLRNALRRLPLLGRVLNQPRAASGCGANCGGCAASPVTSKKINWHPRQR